MPTRPRLTPAMADVRRAVRDALALAFPDARSRVHRDPTCGAPGGWVIPEDAPLVLVGLSGGPDSLALAAAMGFEQGKCGVRAGAVIVDHGLQVGSADIAQRAAEQARQLGLSPVLVRRVDVAGRRLSGEPNRGLSGEPNLGLSGEPNRGLSRRSRIETSAGPEANARVARYAAFNDVAAENQASAILLGHTLDDQAETVLLGLARGSGARSLAGMRVVTRWSGLDTASPTQPAPHFDTASPTQPAPHFETASPTQPTLVVLRPLLALTREVVHRSLADQGHEAWHDPHNEDDRFARVRVRRHVLPLLEAELGPGVAEALARTAAQLTDDADLLDELADKEIANATTPDGGLSLTTLQALPPALMSRVVRTWLLRCGVTEATADTVQAVLHLASSPTNGSLDVPGGKVVTERGILRVV